MDTSRRRSLSVDARAMLNSLMSRLAELTVRETVLFSARLRLNSEDPNLAGDEIKQKYTDQVLRTLELTSLADCVVGRDGEGGLSFEQRKRLSIAVELAASPSIIFLDEVSSHDESMLVDDVDVAASSLLMLCRLLTCSIADIWIGCSRSDCLLSRALRRSQIKDEQLLQRFINQAVLSLRCLYVICVLLFNVHGVI